jgi:hypothetical protein
MEHRVIHNSKLKFTIMTQLQKIIIGVNLLILMLYTVFFYKERTNHLAIVGVAFVLACHLSATIFAATVAHFLDKEDTAKAFWLSTGVVLLIGFGTCVIIHN